MAIPCRNASSPFDRLTHTSWRPPIEEDADEQYLVTNGRSMSPNYLVAKVMVKDYSFLMIIFLSKVVAVKLLS